MKTGDHVDDLLGVAKGSLHVALKALESLSVVEKSILGVCGNYDIFTEGQIRNIIKSMDPDHKSAPKPVEEEPE